MFEENKLINSKKCKSLRGPTYSNIYIYIYIYIYIDKQGNPSIRRDLLRDKVDTIAFRFC